MKKKNTVIALPEIMHEPTGEELMHSFRETFSTAESINDEGVKALANSILIRAAQDYYDVCDEPDVEIVFATSKKNGDQVPQAALRTRHMLEKFIDSDWYEMLSNIDRNVFRNTIKKMKAEGIKMPGTNDAEQRQTTQEQIKKITEMPEYSEKQSKRHRSYANNVKVG